MGIDFSHCDARWSYSGFHAFRCRLFASVSRSPLDSMEGFGGSNSWDEIKDPTVPFIHHSDCDGKLAPEDCKAVAPRLREIVSAWPADDVDRLRAEELARGMDLAAERNEPLIFY